MIEDSPCDENFEEDQLEAEFIEATPEISFHVIASAEHPQTIQVLGKLQNKSLIMLIDGGSTHNFIDQAIATRFGLPIVRDRKLRERVECAGHCQGIRLSIQVITITTDYYVLPVAACQVVLGVQWLETLGPVETDYKQLTITFKIDGVRHTLQGLGQEAETSRHTLQGLGQEAETSRHTLQGLGQEAETSSIKVLHNKVFGSTGDRVLLSNSTTYKNTFNKYIPFSDPMPLRGVCRGLRP
jgi:hypothetical protein